MSSTPLTDRFVKLLDARAQKAVARFGELETVLSGFLADGRRGWPGVALADDDFLAHLARLLNGDPASAAELPALRGADLFLAGACARGDSKAIRALEEAYFGEVDQAMARARPPGVQADDVKQLLREKLFVAREGEVPKVAEYSGRGELRRWVRATVTRTVLNLASRGPKEAAVEDDVLSELPGGDLDPELEHLKQLYRAEFKAVFPEALATLAADERTLLRQRYVDGLTIDQLDSVYGQHRSTVARRLAKAETSLMRAVRERLMDKLKINQRELSSLVRLIRSQIEVSLKQAFK
ncbi:MAG TPA: sigma-70 family RNA polymerase sigma factor [Myxococcales bacterium]|nr:sigma-70 family RNA polymerase sigma factor [Myxococcales bacterium]